MLKRLALLILLLCMVHAVWGQEAGSETATVPDVTGLNLPQAAALLNREGLRLGQQTGLTWTEASGLPPGSVTGQSIAPGETVPHGTAVDLTVLSSPNALLIYDDNDITLVNQTGAPINLNGIVLNSLGGQSAASFSGSRWAPTVDDGNCAQLWSIGATSAKRLPECGSTRWLTTNNTAEHFWTGSSGAAQFEIVQDGVQRAICPVSTEGRCAFYLPAAGTDVTDYLYFVYTTDAVALINNSDDRWMPSGDIWLYNYNPSIMNPGAVVPYGDAEIYRNPDTVADITRLAPGQCLVMTSDNPGGRPPQRCDVIAQLDLVSSVAFWLADFEVLSRTDGQRRTCPAATPGRLTLCIMPR